MNGDLMGTKVVWGFISSLSKGLAIGQGFEYNQRNNINQKQFPCKIDKSGAFPPYIINQQGYNFVREIT